MRERAVLGNKPLQRLEMRVVAEHGGLREQPPGAPRFVDAEYAAFCVTIAGLSTRTCFPAASAAMIQCSCIAFGSER